MQTSNSCDVTFARFLFLAVYSQCDAAYAYESKI